MSKGKVALGALAGLAVGSIAGILLAPEKGSKTRKQIMDKGDGYIGDLKSKYDKFTSALTNKFESAKQEAEETVSAGKAKYDGVKNEVKNVAKDLKRTVS